MKIIRFRRLNREKEYIKTISHKIDGSIVEGKIPLQRWEIAFTVRELQEKLNGELVEVMMPSKAWYIQLYRKFFPLKGIELNVGETGELICN